MRIEKLVYFLFFVPFLCCGIDVKPWIDKEYEVEIRAKWLFQHYKSIQTPHHNYKRNENDHFWSLSAAFPFRRYRGEFELTAAHTHRQNRRIDNFRISFAYMVLEDTSDPLNLMVGIILTEPLSRALHDVSSFHHGHINAEFFLSFGNRIGSCFSNGYSFRYWNVCGLGCSDMGSSWIREDVACEFQRDIHSLRLFSNTLWGLGKENLKPYHFKGYGWIKHRSVDVGVRYGCCFGYLGTLTIQYARRVYAHNFPQNANLVLLEYYLPFGYQNPTTY